MVDVYTMAVFSQEGTRGPEATFSIDTITLAWDDTGGWLVDDTTSRPGPVPNLAVGQFPLDAGSFGAQLEGFDVVMPPPLAPTGANQ